MHQRNISLDVLKLILAIFVVGIHTGFLKDISLVGNSLTENGIFRIAVPIFLLINGFYFFTIDNSSKYYKWLQRVVILYVLWMLIYSYYWFKGLNLSSVMILLFGYWHLWYISALIGASLVLYFIKDISSRILIVLVFVSFLLGVVIQYIGLYYTSNSLILEKFLNHPMSHRNFLFFAFPFFSLGYIIAKYNLHMQVSKKKSFFFLIIGVLLLILESFTTYSNHHINLGIDNFFSLIIIAPFLFLFIINIDMKSDSKKIALLSTGIYFIHPLIINLFKNFLSIENGTALTFIVFISSFVCTLAIIELNKKIKYIL